MASLVSLKWFYDRLFLLKNQIMEKNMTIDDINKITVKDYDELRHIIHERYDSNHDVIDVSDLDVSSVKSFYKVFKGCGKLKVIKGLETWNTSNV